VISDGFTYLTYRWHWHYTVQRGLDYLRLTPAIDDARLDDAIALLRQRRKPNGALAAAEADSRHAARRNGEARRREPVDTLHALRVLRRRDGVA
jgi:hypothetical protein